MRSRRGSHGHFCSVIHGVLACEVPISIDCAELEEMQADTSPQGLCGLLSNDSSLAAKWDREESIDDVEWNLPLRVIRHELEFPTVRSDRSRLRLCQ